MVQEDLGDRVQSRPQSTLDGSHGYECDVTQQFENKH